jgi:hypothetical protein
MNAYSFISHRMFVAAVGHNKGNDGSNASDDRLIEVEMDKARLSSICRARPLRDSELPIHKKHVLVSGFTACS